MKALLEQGTPDLGKSHVHEQLRPPMPAWFSASSIKSDTRTGYFLMLSPSRALSSLTHFLWKMHLL